MASSVWASMNASGAALDDVAATYRNPVGAVREAIRYSETNKQLIFAEAEEERRSIPSVYLRKGA
jgi:hypothetical protein